MCELLLQTQIQAGQFYLQIRLGGESHPIRSLHTSISMALSSTRVYVACCAMSARRVMLRDKWYKILGVDLAKDLHNSNIVKTIRKVLPFASKRTSLLPTSLTFPKHFGASIKHIKVSDLADHTEITKVLKSEHEKTKIRRWTVEYIF